MKPQQIGVGTGTQIRKLRTHRLVVLTNRIAAGLCPGRNQFQANQPDDNMAEVQSFLVLAGAHQGPGP